MQLFSSFVGTTLTVYWNGTPCRRSWNVHANHWVYLVVYSIRKLLADNFWSIKEQEMISDKKALHHVNSAACAWKDVLTRHLCWPEASFQTIRTKSTSCSTQDVDILLPFIVVFWWIDPLATFNLYRSNAFLLKMSSTASTASWMLRSPSSHEADRTR
jgi:hypothetical protein